MRHRNPPREGAGNARFREQVAEGLANAGKTLQSGDVPPGFMLFTMWLDGMKYAAEHGKGNVLFFDGSKEPKRAWSARSSRCRRSRRWINARSRLPRIDPVNPPAVSAAPRPQCAGRGAGRG